MKHRSTRETADYEPPRLEELGTLSLLTLAEGNHYGKVMGGSDAFLMRGHGALTAGST